MLADGVAVGDLEEDGVGFATVEVDEFGRAKSYARVVDDLAHD